MKNIMIILVFASLVILTSCGSDSDSNPIAIQGDMGQSCFSEVVEGGVNIICGDDIKFLPNGIDGVAGIDGENGLDGEDGEDGTFDGEIEYVIICENIRPIQFPETLLFLNGQFLAFFEAPQGRRLVILVENVLYGTTDGRNVRFKIVNGAIDCL